MQETAPGKGLVAEALLQRRLAGVFTDTPDCEARCEDFMDQMRGHAGLLVDRGGRQFGFIHLTFMEYLAGRALARQYLDPKRGADAVVVTLIDHAHDPDWRETSLLCLAALSKSHGSPEGAAAVIDGLLDQEPTVQGQAALLCGLALRDLGTGGVTADCFEHARGVLLESMRAGERVSARTRIECGEVLAALGDPRPGVTTLDGMEFCWVPAGSFFLGSTDEDPDAVDNERQGAGEHWLRHDYWIARHPVTVSQFAEYVRVADVAPEDPDSVKGCPTSPVTWVSWLEADAFCRWLTGHWRDTGLLPDGWAVVLPSEPEWEKAARGGDEVPETPLMCTVTDVHHPGNDAVRNPMMHRRWPWGDEFEPDACHHNGHEVYRPSPVGCFPAGSSPYGCEDMSGNVWEWTRSLWEGYPYPKDGRALKEREDRMGKGSRVLRGGAFFNLPRYVRCAFRLYDGPDYWFDRLGFRVVLSPFPLVSEASDL
jgi:iron(II)-dependent oxidoreductase